MPGTRSECPPGTACRAGGRPAAGLDAVPLVRGLPAPTRAALVNALRPFPVHRHQIVVQDGAPATHLYVVLQGAVMAWKRRGAQHSQVTGFLFAGDLLGAPGAARYAASARAVVDGTLARLPHDRLNALADRHPELRHALYRTLASDVALAQDQLLILGAMGAAERVATALLQFDRRQRVRGVAGGVPVWLPMRRTDLASYLGLELPTLSRTFGRLRRDRVIACPTTTEVAIRDREALARLARAALV